MISRSGARAQRAPARARPPPRPLPSGRLRRAHRHHEAGRPFRGGAAYDAAQRPPTHPAATARLRTLTEVTLGQRQSSFDMLMASVTIDLFLAITGLYALSQRSQYATRVRNYMHTRPERAWVPRWFFTLPDPSDRML